MTTLSRGSVGDACAMRYVSGEKARRVLGFENVVGLEESIRQSCVVSVTYLSSTMYSFLAPIHSRPSSFTYMEVRGSRGNLGTTGPESNVLLSGNHRLTLLLHYV